MQVIIALGRPPTTHTHRIRETMDGITRQPQLPQVRKTMAAKVTQVQVYAVQCNQCDYVQHTTSLEDAEKRVENHNKLHHECEEYVSIGNSKFQCSKIHNHAGDHLYDDKVSLPIVW